VAAAHHNQHDPQRAERDAARATRTDRLPVQEAGQEHRQHWAERDQEGRVTGRRTMDSHHQEAVEQRVAEKTQQHDHAPVARPKGGAERPHGQARRDQDGGRDRTAEGGERERREEGLGRLDRGIAPAPDQDDEEEDRDDSGVGRPASRGTACVRQRVFMSSGKLEEKE
jgi:hypothetical protein